MVGSHRGNELKREGKEEAQRLILYNLPLPIPVPFTAEKQKWLRDQRREYGVPPVLRH